MLNIVQATVNQSHTLLGYVTKQKHPVEVADCSENHSSNNDNAASECCKELYRVFIVELTTDEAKVHNLEIERSKQVRIQFLYREKEQLTADKFLVLIHHECKKIYKSVVKFKSILFMIDSCSLTYFV